MRAELAAVDWPVRTDRLLLRRLRPGDVDAVWSYRRLPEVNRWLTTAPTSLADFREHFDEPERLAKTLVLELDGAVIGDLMLAIEDPYAKEAVRALFRISFESLGLRRLVAGCFVGNEPSWRLMERLGMRRESHVVRASLHRSGEWLDGYVYALLRDEWTPT
jgi:RimJ/RimL family protein N-acetyltransferase